MQISSCEGIKLLSTDSIIFYDNTIDEKKEAKIIKKFNIKSGTDLFHLIINGKQQSDEYEIHLHSPKQIFSEQIKIDNFTKQKSNVQTVHDMPKFPLKVSDDFEVLSIGKVVPNKHFHTDKYIYPLGYVARRFEISVKNTKEKEWYLLKILKDDHFNPIFRIEMENDASVFFQNSMPTTVCTNFYKRIKENKKLFFNGPEFFGLSIPVVHFIIQNLDGVNKLSNYQKKSYIMQEESEIKESKHIRLKFQMGGACVPEINYMVNLESRMKKIKDNYVDPGEYFVINRSRQTGKTTTLFALTKYLKSDYIIFFVDLEDIYGPCFNDESFFTEFLICFLKSYEFLSDDPDLELVGPLKKLLKEKSFNFREFLDIINLICKRSPKKLVLIIDEIDRLRKTQIFSSNL